MRFSLYISFFTLHAFFLLSFFLWFMMIKNVFYIIYSIISKLTFVFFYQVFIEHKYLYTMNQKVRKQKLLWHSTPSIYSRYSSISSYCIVQELCTEYQYDLQRKERKKRVVFYSYIFFELIYNLQYMYLSRYIYLLYIYETTTCWASISISMI